jgi:RimJ/RimL family protein N-acetyltransferase
VSLRVPTILSPADPGLALTLLEPADLPILGTWFRQSHVRRWWDAPDAGVDEIAEHLGEDNVAPYMIRDEGRPIGYLQLYHANPDAFWQAHRLPVETFGLDLFLGEPDALARGLGTRSIRLALGHLRRQPGVARIQIDPSPDNERAIGAYARCGFQPAGMLDTPDGPAAYMIIDIEKERR